MAIITVKLDAKKLDKTRFFQGKADASGHAPLYIDLVLIERKTPGKYGATHIVKQSVTKEERANRVDLPIIGEATMRSFDGGKSQSPPPRESTRPPYQRREMPRGDDAGSDPESF